MNKYECFWNGQRTTVSAASSFQAQEIALSHFKTCNKRRKILGHQISVVLVETSNGQSVAHNPADLTN